MASRSYRPVIGLALAAAALTAGLWVGLGVGRPPSPAGPAQVEGATVLPAPRPLTGFSLVDQAGRPFGLERLKGQWSLLFFGYTHCPDICPMTLATLKQVRERLAAVPGVAGATRVVFVSVDPDRDTPGQIQAYLAHFGPEFVGVTGEEGQLQAFTRQLGVFYARAAPAVGDGYAVDHTASILLVDAEARLRAILSAPHDARTIAGAVVAIQGGGRQAPVAKGSEG
jgi:protein SCO1/2